MGCVFHGPPSFGIPHFLANEDHPILISYAGLASFMQETHVCARVWSKVSVLISRTTILFISGCMLAKSKTARAPTLKMARVQGLSPWQHTPIQTAA